MKKYIYSLLILAIAGSILSGILFMQHYFPDNQFALLMCGENCASVSLSDYSALFGIPVAAFGLLFYLTAAFIILIADYAKGEYPDTVMALLLPVSAIAVCADIALGIILIMIREFCSLCFYTYLINIAFLSILIIWYRLKKKENIKITDIYRNLMKIDESESSSRKAAVSSFTLAFFLLAFSIFSTSEIMKARTEKSRTPAIQAKSFLKSFYKYKVENLQLPDSPLVIGNPEAKVTIIAFTDFLCSACYGLYVNEKYLLSKFKGRVKIVFYNMPLDMSCNKSIKRTVYKNSCTASKAMIAASKNGFFEKYHAEHFSNYKKIKHDYNLKISTDILDSVLKNEDSSSGKINKRIFTKTLDSNETTEMLDEHIKLAKRYKITATPTLFIGNRRIVGVPPKEILSAIVKSELRNIQD